MELVVELCAILEDLLDICKDENKRSLTSKDWAFSEHLRFLVHEVD